MTIYTITNEETSRLTLEFFKTNTNTFKKYKCGVVLSKYISMLFHTVVSIYLEKTNYNQGRRQGGAGGRGPPRFSYMVQI